MSNDREHQILSAMWRYLNNHKSMRLQSKRVNQRNLKNKRTGSAARFRQAIDASSKYDGRKELL